MNQNDTRSNERHDPQNAGATGLAKWLVVILAIVVAMIMLLQQWDREKEKRAEENRSLGYSSSVY